MDGIITHFSPPGSNRTACGRPVKGCEASDFLRDVDCKRCLVIDAVKNADDRRFTVNVWNWEGNLVKKFRNQTADQVTEIENRYADQPEFSMEVDED